MKIPYSEDNVNKEPKPANIFLTMGPASVNMIIHFIAQTEAQGWQTRFILFAGAEPVNKLSINQNTMIPLYHAIICKEFIEGEEMIEPVIRQPLPVNGRKV